MTFEYHTTHRGKHHVVVLPDGEMSLAPDVNKTEKLVVELASHGDHGTFTIRDLENMPSTQVQTGHTGIIRGLRVGQLEEIRGITHHGETAISRLGNYSLTEIRYNKNPNNNPLLDPSRQSRDATLAEEWS